MPEWLVILIKFAANDLPKLLRRHLSRTIVTAVVGTLALQWLLIGPWGSDKLRSLFLSSILTNDDLLRRYGAYKPSDPTIIDTWSAAVNNPRYTDDFVNDAPSAVQRARYHAQRAQPPFQPLGMKIVISSPDCEGERPPFAQIYMNLARSDLREAGWKIGQTVRLSSQDGRGEAVIAAITSPAAKMPKDIHFYVNKVQYHMLRQTDPTSIVLITASTSKLSQSGDDTFGTVSGINCPNG